MMAALKPDLVAQCWTSFRVAVIPPEAGSAQVQDLRRAFYAGAQGLLSTIMKVMDDGEEPTEADLLPASHRPPRVPPGQRLLRRAGQQLPLLRQELPARFFCSLFVGSIGGLVSASA